MVLLTTKCKERFFKAKCILAFIVIYARKAFYQKYFQLRKVRIRKFIMHCLVWAENFDKMLLYLPVPQAALLEYDLVCPSSSTPLSRPADSQ